MASTSVTTVGGVVIVTQVIPKEDAAIPLQTPANPASQAPPPAMETPPPPSKEDSKKALFLRGEPQGLGIVQIFIGILFVLFSLTAIYSEAFILYSPFGLGVLFLVSGSLAVAAGRQTSVRLVCASLWSNVVGAALGLAAAVYLCFLLARSRPSSMICSFMASDLRNSSSVDEWTMKCSYNLWNIDEVLYGLLGLFLVLAVLQVCVSIIVCVFAGKVIKRFRSYSLVMNEADDSSHLIPAEAPELKSKSDLRPGSLQDGEI